MKMVDTKTAKKIVEELLEQPSEFIKILPKTYPVKEKEKITSDAINSSAFREYFKNISEKDVWEIKNEVLKEITIIGEWLGNSDIRKRTFYNLGKVKSATSSEIAELIKKHPKSVSTYINEFIEKDWVEKIEDDDARKKRYTLTSVGKSYYNLTKTRRWFQDLFDEELSIEETIINFHYEIPLFVGPRQSYWDMPDYEDYPPADFLIHEIEKFTDKFVKKLNFEIKVPVLSSMGDHLGKISVNTINEDELAIILAAFNYLRENREKNRIEPIIYSLKIITALDYLDFLDPEEFFSQRGETLSQEETQNFIKKCLTNFKAKLNEAKENND